YDEAARVLEEAIDVAFSAGLDNTAQWALADLGVCRLHQGDPAAAEELFARAAFVSEHVGDNAGLVLATYGNALLAQVRGDWDAARAGFTQARTGFLSLATPVPEALAVAGVARCDEAEGLLDAAREGYQEAAAMGERSGEPGVLASAYEGLGRVAALQGDWETAEKHFAEAAETRDRGTRPAPPHEARDLEAVLVRR
ncbi:MAG TPA: tetratricopeptide repeat protein, partial [Nocardioidaceae bacterium]|nr:tetratricopeptide repeat protein [Nocardioidaceae bacterium]